MGRFLSFDKDIIDDVEKQFAGKYTRQQIEDIYITSISYIHYLLRFTDVLSVRIPTIGIMYFNVPEAKKRLLRLKKKRIPSKKDLIEMDVLDKKITLLAKENHIRNPFFHDVRQWMKKMRRGFSWMELENFQNSRTY